MKPIFFGQNAGAGSSEAVALSDNFNRADSTNLGANWTEVLGGMQIASNFLLVIPGDFADNLTMHNTPVGVTTQYQRVRFILGASPSYPAMMFRCTGNTGAGYSVAFGSAENLVQWWRISNIATGAGATQIGTNQSIDIEDSDVFGVTLTDFGDNTVVRIWRNPSGLPITAANWNGDTSPDVSLTSNPPTPADIGTRLGLWCQVENDNGFGFDDWSGGSL